MHEEGVGEGIDLVAACGGLRAGRGLEPLEVLDPAPAQPLREQRMDEIQMPDEAHARLVQHLAGELARRAAAPRGPGEPQALAPLVKEPLYAEPGHTATTR